jgi:carotenoid cleavage dioxygenase-like enzyme
MGEKNVFFFWPDTSGKMGTPEGILTNFRRFTIDPKSTSLVLPPPEPLGDYDVEFPRMDERYTGRNYNHSFMDLMVKSETDWPAIAHKMGAGFPLYNNIAHHNHATREWRMFNVGDTSMVQEPIFIPRGPDAPEGDGFVMALVSRYETFSSDIVILDTNDWTRPVAVVQLPCKLRPGIHGNWVDATDIIETTVPKLNT